MFKIITIICLLFTTLYADKNLQKVSLQLQWKHQFQFAGFYIAKERGFYKDVGLDVEIKEFNYDVKIIDDVYEEKTTFGTSYPSAILEKFNGKEIVLLSAILQQSPHMLVTLKSSGIKSIKDFKNKKIMIEDKAILTATIKSMLESNHVSFDDMTRVKHTFNIEDLISGKTDIATAFSSNEPYTLDKRGIEYNLWDPKDYGFDFYEMILFTSGSEIKKNPKRVEDFRKASLKGWEYAFGHIDESVELILKKYNTQNRTKNALVYEANVLKKLAYSGRKKLGDIDKNKIQRIYDMYNLMGLIKNKIEFNQFIYNPVNNILTKKEKKYLKDKKQITMCIDPHWMPFESFDKNGFHIGMSADYFKIFQNIIDTEIVPIQTKTWVESLEYSKNRKCDILSLAMQTPMRKEYLSFTTPYLKIPLVIATKIDVAFINDIKSLEDKKVGIPKGYAFAEVLKDKYPNLNIVEVQNVDEGLKKVNQGKLFGYIGTIASIGHEFQIGYNSELKIAGKFDEKWELSIAVRDDDQILLNILQKAVNSLDTKLQQEILNNWVSIKYEKGIDYTLVWKILIIGFIIIVFFIYREYLLKKINSTLEAKVEEEVNKNHQKDEVLFHQSKLASMGEMLGNISHQWRQPLNRVNLSLSVIESCLRDDNIDKEFIENKINSAQNNIFYMSQTIDDFSNFFTPNKKMQECDIVNTTDKVLKLLENRLLNIELNLNSNNQEIIFEIFENELMQVLLIILNNAIDNFEIKAIDNPTITIDISKSDKNLILKISDNGSGIKKENLDKVFEPYFTTKFKSEGTGLGLYMTKMLIEESMGGEIKVLSDEIGATFIITLGSKISSK